MTSHFVRMPAAAVAALCALAFPLPAYPCSGPQCLDAWPTAPREGDAIPANAPAAVVRTSYHSEWGRVPQSGVPEPVGVRLLYPDGGEVPAAYAAEPGAWIVHPDAGFVEGQQYLLTTDPFCQFGPWTPDAGLSVPFVAASTAPLPSVPATLVAGPADVIDFHEGGSCHGPVGQVAVLPLELTPSPQMQPWLPVTRWRLMVDGQLWAEAPYGRVGDAPPQDLIAARTIYFLHAQCTRDAGVDPGLEPGTHTIKLEAQVAGDPAVYSTPEQEVTLDCPDPANRGTPGCSSAAGSAASAPTVLGAAALLALTRGRRRTR